MILYVISAIILVLLIYMAFEARMIKLEKVILNAKPGSLKIAHLSDIHFPLLRISAQNVRRVLDKEAPDIIILTGDYIERARDAGSFLKFLAKIKGGRSMYAVLGNHDYRAFRMHGQGVNKFVSEMRVKGVEVLMNSSFPMTKGSCTYNIIGISDYTTGQHDIKKAYDKIKPSKNNSNANNVNIVISHNPDIVFELPSDKTDYLFSGHLHGGQIRAPFNFEFVVLRDDKLGKIGKIKGLHRLNNINVYINRGLGNVVVPLRFLSRPEITIYNI